MFKESKIIKDEKYGFYKMEPTPTDEKLKMYYEQKYYEEIKNKQDSIKKIIKNNDESQHEIDWLRNTYFSDALKIFNRLIPNSNPLMLDVGCGLGEMAKYFKEKSFNVLGIEPSEEACEFCRNNDIDVYNGNFYEFIEENNKQFDIVNLSDVLEHIPNPEEFLKKCSKILKDKGVMRIKVPNDFNKFQEFAQVKYELKRWWISVPDHINYFNIQSIVSLLESIGFGVVHKTSDFPMELFLLMGDNYIENPELGKLCHEKRKNFEKNISYELRQILYNSLCEIGLGREIIIYATKK